MKLPHVFITYRKLFEMQKQFCSWPGLDIEKKIVLQIWEGRGNYVFKIKLLRYIYFIIFIITKDFCVAKLS